MLGCKTETGKIEIAPTGSGWVHLPSIGESRSNPVEPRDSGIAIPYVASSPITS